MKRLNYTIANELDEYDQISNSKREPSRTILAKLRTRVHPHYQNYLNRFGSIQSQPVNAFNLNHSNNLRNCYYNSTAALDSLKIRLINSQTDTFKLLCPYCLISNHSTFDHYVPIEEQPVFGVLARNLVPCCDGCNKRKLQYWREIKQRAIIHFYNDSIPDVKFLHCDLTFNGTVPILTYRLDLTLLKPKIRSRISKHFTRLDLLNRYNEAVPGIISNVNTDVQSLGVLSPSRPAIGRFLVEKATQQQLICGINYWSALAYEALGNSRTYLKNI